MPKITWYKNDRAVRQAGKTRLTTAEDKDTMTATSTISTKDVDVKRFDGTYLIEATNVAGTAVHEATLIGEGRNIGLYFRNIGFIIIDMINWEFINC